MKLRILGVMTGTSLDGADSSCIEFSLNNTGIESWRVLWNHAFAIPPKLRERLLEIQDCESRWTLLHLLRLESEYSNWLLNHFKPLMGSVPSHRRPHAIAIHGQTVAHHPFERPNGLTWQMLNPHALATHLRLPIVSDFRRGDIAGSGQGAPLVPLFHRELIKSIRKQDARTRKSSRISLHNLGGISNLTLLEPKDRVRAWDTGPANCWIDAAVVHATKGKKKFDADGKMAAQGQADFVLVEEIIETHPYFRKKAPKSTGRDDFPNSYFLTRAKKLSGVDLVATATEITARSISDAYVKEAPHTDVIYFCGGGAKNPTLLNRIQVLLPQIRIEVLPAHWSSPQFVEAEAFAYFGARALLGQSIGGSWTGVKTPGSPASLTIPCDKSWKKLIHQIQSVVP